MLVFVAAGLADPPPGTGFMFTLQSLAKMMMMGVMIMRDDVCGLFSTNIPMIPPPYSIWQNFEAIWPKYELLRLEDKFNNKKFCCKIPEKIWLNIKHFIKRKIEIVCLFSYQSLICIIKHFFRNVEFLILFFQPWEVQTLITVLLDWENLCHDTLETPIGLYLDFWSRPSLLHSYK